MEVDSIEEWEDFKGREEVAVLPVFVCSPGISEAAMQYESSSDNRTDRVPPEANPLQTQNRRHYSSVASSLGPDHISKSSDKYKPKWNRNKHCELQSCCCQKTFFFKTPRSDNFRIIARRNDYVHALGCFLNCFPKVMNNEKICFTIPDEETSEVYNHTTIEELRNFCDEAADFCKEHTNLTSYNCFKYINRFMMLFLYGGIGITVITVMNFLDDMTQIYPLVESGGGSVLLFILICIFHKCINTRTKRLEKSLRKYIDSNRKTLEDKKIRPIPGIYGYWIEFRSMQIGVSPTNQVKINTENAEITLSQQIEPEDKVEIVSIKDEESQPENNSLDIEEEKLNEEEIRIKQELQIEQEIQIKKEKEKISQTLISETVKAWAKNRENLRRNDSSSNSSSSSSEEESYSEDSDKENIPPTLPEEISFKGLKAPAIKPSLSSITDVKSPLSNISKSPKHLLGLRKFPSNSSSSS